VFQESDGDVLVSLTGVGVQRSMEVLGDGVESVEEDGFDLLGLINSNGWDISERRRGSSGRKGSRTSSISSIASSTLFVAMLEDPFSLSAIRRLVMVTLAADWYSSRTTVR